MSGLEQGRGPKPVPEETVLDACGDQSLPEMGVVEQLWQTDPIPTSELPEYAKMALEEVDFSGVPSGGKIAVGAGSRGIANIGTILGGVIDGLKERGYDPFVFPAMGSHGGATADGQIQVLESIGVTAEAIGCEIRATMETVVVGETPQRNVEVHTDANAVAADGILLVNRVKPHTDFQGEVESGLTKMLVIGMGKQRGAKTAHEWAVDWSFQNMLPEITTLLLDELPVLGGVAVVEDEHDDTTILEGVPPTEFLDREAELLERAYELLPTIPFHDIDVLVVDRMGKDISGSGMDTNVIGRLVYGNEPAPETPSVKRIFVRRLTDESHGNAVGMGSADLIHADLFEAIDLSDALVNTITASALRAAHIPPAVETDRAGLVACLSAIGVTPPEEVRVVRIRDTMHLERIKVSAPLVAEARERDALRVVSEPARPRFSAGDFTEELVGDH